jgi:hypothetical protein
MFVIRAPGAPAITYNNRSERMDPLENVYAYEQQPSVC